MDPPRRQVMAQLTRRTLPRTLRHTELWNGDKENWRNLISRDTNRNILLWTWTHQ